ncbi:hypothetical protein B0H12DRAFT_1322500 [Mycena haematopus]|nr:hypothetical protein B0H12DRAFT_1322500 [Mycena haematopus]
MLIILLSIAPNTITRTHERPPAAAAGEGAATIRAAFTTSLKTDSIPSTDCGVLVSLPSAISTAAFRPISGYGVPVPVPNSRTFRRPSTTPPLEIGSGLSGEGATAAAAAIRSGEPVQAHDGRHTYLTRLSARAPPHRARHLLHHAPSTFDSSIDLPMLYPVPTCTKRALNSPSTKQSKSVAAGTPKSREKDVIVQRDLAARCSALAAPLSVARERYSSRLSRPAPLRRLAQERVEGMAAFCNYDDVHRLPSGDRERRTATNGLVSRTSPTTAMMTVRAMVMEMEGNLHPRRYGPLEVEQAALHAFHARHRLEVPLDSPELA